jgi:hypothetical protein
MGFMDKVKSAAQDVTKEAKKATAGAQQKMEQAQVRKKMDENAKQLGYLVYGERAKGTPAGAEADRIVSELSGLEAQLETAAPGDEAPAAPGGPAEPAAGAQPPPTAAPPPSTSASEPTSGDFKL